MALLPDPAALAVFIGASVAISVTPGPDMTYVFARGLAQGRAAALVSVAGIATGLVVHTTLVALGLAVLVAGSPILFDILRYAGAAYLLWMGARLILSGNRLEAQRAGRPASWRAIYMQGLLVNLLNPKILLFFLAFLPQFADPARGALGPQIAVLGAILIGCGLLALGSIALGSAGLRRILARHPLWLRLQGTATGLIMVALAAHLALAARR